MAQFDKSLRLPMRALPYYLPYTLIGLTVLGWSLGNWWTFITPVFVYGIVNFADHIIPEFQMPLLSSSIESPRSEGGLSLYSFSPINWSFMQFGFTVWGLFLITQGGLSFVEFFGTVLSIGVMSGAIGITFAHELVHRKRFGERIFGEILLVLVTYHHWSVEHVHGHHRTVGTPEDPATARRNENVFAFFFRSVIGGFVSSFHLEAARQRRRKRHPVGLRNRVIMGVMIEVGLYCAAGFGLGWEATVGLAAISLIAIFQLEVVNYFEHYGLRRREIAEGRYEPVTAQHSWDDGHRISSWFLANLQRHADHHLRPGVRYDALTLVDDAPRLPAGYATMLGIALIPPLWFAIMNPRVDALRAKEVTLS